MNVVIIEDETLASDKLQSMLQEVDPSYKIIATLRSVESAVEWFQTNAHPDLVLSDIKLLDGLCFEIFKKVSVTKPVIFTTAYDQYAIKAFELNSIDYLLKPIQQEKLVASLNKLKTISVATPPPSYEEVIRYLEAKQTQFKSRFIVKLGQRIVSVAVERIAYFFSENKLTFVVTHDNKKYPMDQTLETIDQIVDPAKFFRVNRQFIVHFSSIGEIHPYFKGRIKITVQPESDHEIVISSDRTPEFKKWLDQ